MSVSQTPNVDPSGVAAIDRMIQSGLIASADYHETLQSTNSLALQTLRGNLAPDLLPRLFLTDNQTAGRGRHGRTWISETNALTFSLLVERSKYERKDSALISIAVGVAIGRAIEFSYAPLQTRLKWPNDVYIDGGKVAGILLETSHTDPRNVVIGIGINVNAAPVLPDTDLAATPKSIAQAVGRNVCRFELLENIVEQLSDALVELADSPSTLTAEFRKRCWLTGTVVRFQDADAKGNLQKTGQCVGINDNGDLMIQTDAGVCHCHSGEVNQVRRDT